jgi:hypothetical protein
VSQIVDFLAEEIKKFDRAAAALGVKYASNERKLQDDVADFIEGCKHYGTGNLVWSLATNRYGVEFADDGSGDILMTL